MKKKVLWIGDAGCATGFAKATEHIGQVIVDNGFEVGVLAIGYRGDPHDLPFKMYTCQPGGDAFGYGRLFWTLRTFEPDLVVIQNDPWNFMRYTKPIRESDEFKELPLLGVAAVDGKNCRGNELNQLNECIFWTEFGRTEAQDGGMTIPGHVIPLGIDLDVFQPRDKFEARRRRGFPDVFPRGHRLEDAYIVGAVNRNQPRKRLDLLMIYFAQWVQKYEVDNAYLYLHVAPTGDFGYDLMQFSRYLGITDRLVFRVPPIFTGDPEDVIVDTYAASDVTASTTQGEGFGLTTFEALACGVPHIAPRWSALGELLSVPMTIQLDGLTFDGVMPAELVRCSSLITTAGDVNSIGGVADRKEYVEALRKIHESPNVRAMTAAAGLELVKQDRFRWSTIGRQYVDIVTRMLA